MSQSLDNVDIAMLRRLVAERDLRQFFEQTADEAAKLVGADGAALIEVLENGTLQYRFFHGLSPAHTRMAISESFSVENSTAGEALLKGEPIFTPDYPGHPKAMPNFVESGLKANLIVPCGPSGEGRAVLAIAWFSHYPTTAPNAHASALIMLLADLMHAALYRQSLEHHLEQMAEQDVLTGLPNRRYLGAYLEKLFGTNSTPHPGWAVAILDLDDFKPVNDQHGHSAGDAVLKEVGARLRLALPESVVTRMGGDEFVLILPPLLDTPSSSGASLGHTLEEVCATLDKPYLLPNGYHVSCRGSIGVAINHCPNIGPEALLAHADYALYKAKRRKDQQSTRWELFDHLPPPENF